MKESFLQLKDFALNIREEIGSALLTLQNLSTEEKMQLACTLAGRTAASMIVGVTTGAILAKALPEILLKLRQVAALLKKLTEIERKGIQLKSRGRLAEEVILCGL